MSVKKINLIDKRWAIRLQDKTAKIDRQLAEVEKMLTKHARTIPVSTNLRHVQSARRELAQISAFARFTKQIARHAEELVP